MTVSESSFRWFSSDTAVQADTLRFAGGALVLNLLPFLPALVSPLPLSPYFPLCIEVLVLVTGLVYARGTRFERPVRVGTTIGVLLLVVYTTYDAAVYTAFQRSGILYEDLQFADNLTYFAFDLGVGRALAGMVLILVGGGGLVWMMHRCVGMVTRAGRHAACRMAVVAVHLGAWPLVMVVAPAQQWGTPNLTYQTTSEQVRYRTIATKAWANARASLRLDAMLDSLGTAPVDSAYFAYDALTLDQRPSIYLFAVESYGTVLDRHPELRGPYRRVLRRTESVLQTAGWHAASARLDAPVRGGRSWLAIASLLTGVRVDRQLVFNRFQGNPDGVPHLVRFLDRQGYRTVALQPFTFERPGLPVRNLYDFDITLYRDDLNYDGPPFGLADAPDQYSLNFAHHTQLAPSGEPYFLFFETVSSHALWNYGLAPVLPDWQLFNTVKGSTYEQKQQLKKQGAAPTPFLPDSITAPRIYDQPMPRRYLQHIAYDLGVIRDYLTDKAPEGSLVLLLGDHQPPLLNTQTSTVPLHILSTDSTLVEYVRRQGLTEGLTLTDASPTLRQEGLYSFLVRLLAAQSAGAEADSTGLPPDRPRGVSPSLLVR
ncbi:hypothetical protein BSZ35_10030 [Salinibacter sp. 10B]|uniref:hypothetical protein n=1 Tax=Salinibacter sp. 10B TaxID=1923971 RepID=UPI000CF3D71A|nr:hypothetical protein [Salinibacter sp. 10B]PQJ34888.1 hypothetical protein BSZ35_10030 [Salinibacter sp. 10B]